MIRIVNNNFLNGARLYLSSYKPKKNKPYIKLLVIIIQNFQNHLSLDSKNYPKKIFGIKIL